MTYIFLFSSIACSVFSQLTIKWRVNVRFKEISFPDSWVERFHLLFTVLTDPFIIIAMIATLASGLLWMAAMTKLDLSFAYPFTSLGFVMVLIMSALLFHEPLNIYKIIGVFFIGLGVFFSSRG